MVVNRAVMDLLAQGGWYAKTHESQQLEMEGGEVDANQNQWSVFKRLLTYLQALQILDLSSFDLPLVHYGYQRYHSHVASYFIDHYLHDVNQAASLILIGCMVSISCRR